MGGGSTALLSARAAARAQPGVTEVLWTSPRELIYVYQGHLWTQSVDPGVKATPIGFQEQGVSDVSLSPDGVAARVPARRRPVDAGARRRPDDARRSPDVARLPGIGRVRLGTYNRADREVGTGVWGADWPPYAWSPDGARIAFHAVGSPAHPRRCHSRRTSGDETVVSELRRGYPGDENERRSLHVVDVRTRAVVDLGLPEPGRRAISDFAWSPSGRLLVDHVADTGAERWLYVVEPGQPRLRLVWHDRRDSRIYPAYVARWHHDGRRILIVADLAERDQLFVVDPDAPAPPPAALTPDTWDVAGERGAATVQVVSGHWRRVLHRHRPWTRTSGRCTASERRSVAGGHHRAAGRPRPGRVTRRPTSGLDLVRRRHAAELLVGDAQPGATLTRVTTPPSEFTQRSLGPPALPDVPQCRARLRRPRAHPRAGRPRSVKAASGDLRAGLLEHRAQPLGRAERHAAAVHGAAGLHRGAGGRAGQRRLRPPLPRGVPDGLRPGAISTTCRRSSTA